MNPEMPPARAGIVDREVVEALRDLAEVLSILLPEFPDQIDRATVNEALQQILDVALIHDALGNYGIYPEIDEDKGEAAAEEVRA
ncbi:MAG: hypothetical protein HWD57_11060 [Candidatus Accumulibacter cognatus]|uniref:Uncharacterized protein n=1 Tax=Candidatus Accumulibacter cognatus TaxID=2954383 RepID=A0A7D5SN78_9PROT|nr:MAG: hypothetical protein HWD57_11060 [Candidatus Accumulibacter cognatus]